MIEIKYIDNSNKHFLSLNDIFDDNKLNIIQVKCFLNKITEIPRKIGQLTNL